MKFEDEQAPEWRECDKTYCGHESAYEYFRSNNMTSLILIHMKYTTHDDNDEASTSSRLHYHIRHTPPKGLPNHSTI